MLDSLSTKKERRFLQLRNVEEKSQPGSPDSWLQPQVEPRQAEEARGGLAVGDSHTVHWPHSHPKPGGPASVRQSVERQPRPTLGPGEGPPTSPAKQDVYGLRSLIEKSGASNQEHTK